MQHMQEPANDLLEQAICAEQVAQQVLEVSPKPLAGQGSSPFPAQLQDLHMKGFGQAV